MNKGALLIVLGSLAMGFSAAAQKPPSSFDAPYTFALYRPEVFHTVDGSTLLRRLPVHSFLDGTRFPVSSELGLMGAAPVDLPSVAYSGESQVQHIGVSTGHRADGKDFSSTGKDGDMSLSRSSPLHFGGEMGVFYGQWSGKGGGDVFGSYLESGIGNDKFQLNVGASYQEWNSHYSRGHH